MHNVNYTFPADFPIKAVAGRSFTGGTLVRYPVNKKIELMILFPALIEGKPLYVRIAGKPELEALLAAHEKAEHQRAEEAARAQAEYEKTPYGLRAKLAREERNTYSPNYFPGTRAWHKNHDAVIALREFDAAHPEIAAEIDAAWRAREAAKYDALSDFVKMGS